MFNLADSIIPVFSGIRFTNANKVNGLKELARQNRIEKIEDIFPLTVEMPCGKIKVYFTIEEFPDKTVKCDCGSDYHYYVEYRWNVLMC